MKMRVCPTCSKEYRVLEWDFKRDQRLFCSQSCKKMATRLFVNCLYCNKIFWVYRSWIARGRGKYCSQRCVGAAFSERWDKKILDEKNK